MNIVIPSYKRPDDVVILKSIPNSYKDKTFLYVRADEFDAYSENYADQATIIPLTGVSCYSSTMDAIIDHQGKNRIWYFDDDDSIHDSWFDDKGKETFVRPVKETVSEESFYEMMEFCNDLADQGYVHGGLRMQLFPIPTKAYPFLPNKRIATNCWFDMTVIPREWIDHSEFDIYTDTSVVLNLWEKGYASAAICKWFHKTVAPERQANDTGTHSYRTLEMHNRCMLEIADKYPKYTRVKWKEKNNVVLSEDSKSDTTQFLVKVPLELPNQVSPPVEGKGADLGDFFNE